MSTKKTILVAPLNWGLGHATRCIPIIDALLVHNFNVLLASDGMALSLLQKEFPELPFIKLPAYNITYPKKGQYFRLNMFLKFPQFQKTINLEKKMVKKLVAEAKIDGLVSDNRLGIRSSKVPSVFITHQLNVLSGSTSYLSSKLHQKIIKKYHACWVPDVPSEDNLSGKLGHPKKLGFDVHYIGPLSRMKPKDLPVTYDILILLSGPEPQRTLLEEKMLEVFKISEQKILLVRGVIEDKSPSKIHDNFTVVNYMKSQELEYAINESELIISRPGYTTIMDLAAMKKKAFFIPTPGQYEQKYLAKMLRKKKLVPCCSQQEFTKEQLKKVALYNGLYAIESHPNFTQLLGLF